MEHYIYPREPGHSWEMAIDALLPDASINVFFHRFDAVWRTLVHVPSMAPVKLFYWHDDVRMEVPLCRDTDSIGGGVSISIPATGGSDTIGDRTRTTSPVSPLSSESASDHQ